MSESAAPAASSSSAPATGAASPGVPSQSQTAGNPTPGAAKGGSPSSKPAASPQAKGSQGAPGGSAPTAQEVHAQLKELGEQDMDAVVKIKVGGQVKQVSVREALKLAEKGEGADQKFQRAAQIENQARQMAQLAKDNPEAFLKKWGIDPDQYSQARLAKMLEDQMMSPEQKKAREDAEWRQAREKADKEREEAAKKEKEDSEFKAADQTYRNEVFESWKDSGLPAHPSFGIEIAKEMLRANSQGTQLTAKQAAANVKRDWIANSGSILDQMDGDALFQALPKTVHDKLRAYYVQQVSGQPGLAGQGKAQSPRPDAQRSASTQNQNSGQKRMLSEKEYREYFENL